MPIAIDGVLKSSTTFASENTLTNLTPNSDQPEQACPNCDAPISGQFCQECGQNQVGFDRFFFTLVAESFENVFALDSRAARTLFALLFRPGYLSLEYFSGRRARYVQPLRLYFITSIAFFFLLSLQQSFTTGDKTGIVFDTGAQTEAAKETQDETEQGDEDALSIEDLDFDFLSEQRKQRLVDRLNTQVKKATAMAKENPQQMFDVFFDLAPPMIFCLLPLFALLLKIVYFSSGRFFTEHLVLAVHNHCFIYIALLLNNLVEALPDLLLFNLIEAVIVLWIPVYLFLSLKTCYRQGWFLTFFKYQLLGFSYFFLFLVGMAIAGLIGLLSL